MTDLDWGRAMLPKVSRTFALGIRMLSEPWEPWVTSSYLLCRIADTIEDAPDLRWSDRRTLFEMFRRAIETGDPLRFAEGAALLPHDDEGELARGLARVLAPLDAYPSAVRREIVRWVSEMTAGMASYAERRNRVGRGVFALDAEDDLLRYCYFVAGTVGHLLTELFAQGSARVAERADVLRVHAVGFGTLLQLTNIVKDVRDDRARGVCFVPRSMCDAHGLRVEDLFAPGWNEQTSAVLRDVIELARRYETHAERYIDALPPEVEPPRKFCSLPLLLAKGTLDLLADDPTRPERKVDRATVAAIVRQGEQRFAAPLRA